jgi:hypothetical protein
MLEISTTFKKKNMEKVKWAFYYFASPLQIFGSQSQKNISNCMVVTLVQLPQSFCLRWKIKEIDRLNQS